VWLLGVLLVGIAIGLDAGLSVVGVMLGYLELNPLVRLAIDATHSPYGIVLAADLEILLFLGLSALLFRYFQNSKTITFVYTVIVAVLSSLHVWKSLEWILLLTNNRG
jgi:hypothetical protein